MPHKSLFAALLLVAALPGWCDDAVESCFEKAETQPDINRCAEMDFRSADRELDQVYQAVLTKHGAQPGFIEKLKAAQRAWVKWRDAELEALYPEEDKAGAYGSGYAGCRDGLLAALSKSRTEQLRKWLDGVEQGDACAGSVPLIQ